MEIEKNDQVPFGCMKHNEIEVEKEQ